MPEVTLAVIERELPGFGDAIRHHSFQRGPIALLSRAVAGVRGTSLVMNLPSRPKPVLGCLKLLREAMVECMDQITGVRHQLHTDEIEIPLEKWMPFLKRFRIKPDPRWGRIADRVKTKLLNWEEIEIAFPPDSPLVLVLAS